jgi:hypothetical protein
MSAYQCRHFQIQELVPRAMFERFRDVQELLWMAFDQRLLWAADALRDHFGVCSVNTWVIGGEQDQCGLRMVDSPVGTALSQHRFGRALDLHFKTATPDEVRKEILKSQWPYITRIERDTPTWVHVDVGNHDREKFGILVVSG